MIGVVKLKGFQKLTFTDQALQTWLETLRIGKPKVEQVALQDALGRVLAEDIIAEESLPRFDKSAMDGYALSSADSVGASQSKPAGFLLTDSQEIGPKQAKPIWTGNPIPKGADAVVILENTEKEEGNLEVWVDFCQAKTLPKLGKTSKKALSSQRLGHRLNPYHIGLAAALGFQPTTSCRETQNRHSRHRKRIGRPGAKLSGSLIYDSNKIMISGVCRELGAETTDYGIAKDNLGEIAEKIREALKTQDAVITTGGTSVGGFDLVPDAVNKLGKPGVVVHGVALRPAMPTALSMLEGKPVLILSGNPVAAIVGFEVFGRPMVCRLLGMVDSEPRPMLKAVLRRRVSSALGQKRTFGSM